jgi:hypothetical protein
MDCLRLEPVNAVWRGCIFARDGVAGLRRTRGDAPKRYPRFSFAPTFSYVAATAATRLESRACYVAEAVLSCGGMTGALRVGVIDSARSWG